MEGKKVSIKPIVFFLLWQGLLIATSQCVAACMPIPNSGSEISLTDGSTKIRLVSQDNVDTPSQSTINQKYAFVNVSPAPTEVQVKLALDQIFSNAKETCKKNTLQGVRIFLFTSQVTTVSSSWVARLDTENMRPKIDIRNNMIFNGEKGKVDLLACDPSVAPGKSLNLYPKLPPLSKRKILGTWAYDGIDVDLTVSLEEVAGKVYKVFRTKYCSSGNSGEPLRKGANGRYYRKDSRAGDYYVILPGGELGVFDRDGKIDARPVHVGLFPRK